MNEKNLLKTFKTFVVCAHRCIRGTNFLLQNSLSSSSCCVLYLMALPMCQRVMRMHHAPPLWEHTMMSDYNLYWLGWSMWREKQLQDDGHSSLVLDSIARRRDVRRIAAKIVYRQSIRCGCPYCLQMQFYCICNTTLLAVTNANSIRGIFTVHALRLRMNNEPFMTANEPSGFFTQFLRSLPF